MGREVCHAGGVVMRKFVAGAVTSVTVLVCAAAADAYEPGFYSGHNSQGWPITFVASGGQVSDLLTEVTDSCNPGKWYVTLYPHPARVNSRGSWSHRTPGPFPTVYHGHLSGAKASGTIDDKSQNNSKRTCR